jgi:outer membrane lipoprotein-sorting protein
MGMEHRAVSPHHSVAFGIAFALAAMTLSFLAVLALSSNAHVGSAAQAQYSGSASDGCATTSQVRLFTGTQDKTTEPFRITGDKFRIAFETERNGGNPRLEVIVLTEHGQTTGQRFVVGGGDDGSRIIPLGPGTFRLELRADHVRYRIAVQECRADIAGNVNVAQAATTPLTTAETTATTADTSSADSNSSASADAQTAGDGSNVDRSADAFRCDFFLHVVRDDRGNVRGQYRDDELIVRRFEQCLSKDVIADTIPRRRLPSTGGSPLALLAAGVLLVSGLVAGASVLRAATRRRR